MMVHGRVQENPARVLMVVELPFWRRETGAHQRICALLEAMDAAGLAVRVFYPPGLRAADRACLRAHLPWLPVDTPALPLLILRAIRRRMRRLGLRTPTPSELAWERRRALRNVCLRFRPHTVLVQFLWSAYLVEGLRARLPYRPEFVIDTHDILHLRSERLVESRGMTRAQEVSAWRQFDWIIAIQEREAEIMRALLPDREVLVAGHPGLARPPAAKPAAPVRLLFAAAAGAHNEAAMLGFLEAVWPGLRAAHGEAVELHIAGRICGKLDARAAPEGVVIHGFVPDLAPHYAATHIAINPVFAGSGLKIKNIEAICHALPLVTTPQGAEGMPEPGDAFVVCDTWDTLRAALDQLIQDADARTRLADAAYAYAQKHLRADQVFQAVLARLQQSVESSA